MLSILLLFLALIGGSAARGWKYGQTQGKEYGPERWGELYRNCGGSSQSPVNINTSKVEEYKDDDEHRLRVNFGAECGYTKGTMMNNGRYPMFIVKEGGATLKNPINGDEYKLTQLHFHFGCNDSVGSEHTVDGKSYLAEMQLIFFNTKYRHAFRASRKPDGMTVIGVFLEIGQGRSVSVLNSFFRQVEEISKPGAEVRDFTAHLAGLVPELSTGKLDYYSYKGSLTGPPCSESANWLILKKPIAIDTNLMQSLRTLQGGRKILGKMCNNFRPTQPLNGREIKLYSH